MKATRATWEKYGVTPSARFCPMCLRAAKLAARSIIWTAVPRTGAAASVLGMRERRCFFLSGLPDFFGFFFLPFAAPDFSSRGAFDFLGRGRRRTRYFRNARKALEG